MSALITNLPRVKEETLPLYDHERQLCCGFLNKKASKASQFSKGKWQKRWFLIDTNLPHGENYSLSYFYAPDDKEARQIFALKKSSVVSSGGNSFTITFEDETTLELQAETVAVMDKWIFTLEKIITTANMRDRIACERPTHEEATSPNAGFEAFRSQGSPAKGHHQNVSSSNPFRNPIRLFPTLRFDIDIATIQPSSTQRRQFEEMFVNDIVQSLKIEHDMIEIISVKPAPGMPWLTLVEFDIYVFSNDDDDDGGEKEEAQLDLEQERTQELQKKLLWTLNEMVSDTQSPLYHGFVTCKLDPSYAKNFVEESAMGSVEVMSPVPQVLEVLNKYKDIHVPSTTLDLSHFTIYLKFEDRLQPLLVPNPLVLRRRCCAIWPFEVKQALGLMGTMQELWLEPLALAPCDMPKSLSQPIVFEPSARLNGAVSINASRLKADLTYEVQCEDYRGNVLRELTEKELEEMKKTFDSYDINGDGCISKNEIEDMVRERVQGRKDVIDKRFEELTKEPGVTQEELQQAEEMKSQHLQHLNESQSKLLGMFEAADLNGDGVLTFTEFILAESWWLKCTLNPSRAHLF